ncbi:hypothetical protein RclHR1_00080004 [Rhizophagus clarus]|uniref:Uncharacterized protein n=1 Tax=Rhizophagus clarus TaxID=94130 RepID=A0A2Z6SMA3_9GLOM|nr:hypothetical protein RclHR1_00080004 [Rhizophagus clarus]GET04074.1 hypothetical protein RCL_jg24402.t1 [Rhizophagus clarus]
MDFKHLEYDYEYYTGFDQKIYRPKHRTNNDNQKYFEFSITPFDEVFPPKSKSQERVEKQKEIKGTHKRKSNNLTCSRKYNHANF